MRSIVLGVIVLLGASSAHAGVPQFRATCPGGILAAGGGGTVFINGDQASVKDHGGNNFSASSNGIQIDFSFDAGEPSLSYTGPRRANGMCTITKFQPAAAPAGRPAGNNMAAECKGFASEKFGVRPSYVSVHPAFRDHGMYSMFGNADDRNFICTFDRNGKFIAVDESGDSDGAL